MSKELSSAVKDFITNFEYVVLPNMKDGEFKGVIKLSKAAAADPQLRELIGVDEGEKNGSFLGISVTQVNNLSVEMFDIGLGDGKTS